MGSARVWLVTIEKCSAESTPRSASTTRRLLPPEEPSTSPRRRLLLVAKLLWPERKRLRPREEPELLLRESAEPSERRRGRLRSNAERERLLRGRRSTRGGRELLPQERRRLPKPRKDLSKPTLRSGLESTSSLELCTMDGPGLMLKPRVKQDSLTLAGINSTKSSPEAARNPRAGSNQASKALLREFLPIKRIQNS